MMESPVCLVTPESLDPPDTQHILEDSAPRWPVWGMRNRLARWACFQGQGEKLVQEGLLDRTDNLVIKDHKDPLEMLVKMAQWDQQGQGDLTALQESLVKMVKQANLVTLERWDSLAQRGLEDFLAHLDHLDSKDTEVMGVQWGLKVKEEQLDQRAPLVGLVQLGLLDPWVLLACLEREGVQDPVEHRVCEAHLETWANQAPRAPWASMDLQVILDSQE